MSGVEIRHMAALKGQRGSKNGKDWQPAPLYRASWSTDLQSALTLLNAKHRSNFL